MLEYSIRGVFNKWGNTVLPVLLQAEDVAEPVLPPVSCSYHDAFSLFAGLVGVVRPAILHTLSQVRFAFAGLALPVSRAHIRSGRSI